MQQSALLPRSPVLPVQLPAATDDPADRQVVSELHTRYAAWLLRGRLCPLLLALLACCCWLAAAARRCCSCVGWLLAAANRRRCRRCRARRPCLICKRISGC
jgi:hypothetical protein